MQSVEAVLPAGELELAAHSVQASLPAAALYLPASHAEHSPPSGPVYPALHSQSVSAALAAPDMVLSGQAVHAVASTSL